jgi:hypothetical protein
MQLFGLRFFSIVFGWGVQPGTTLFPAGAENIDPAVKQIFSSCTGVTGRILYYRVL